MQWPHVLRVVQLLLEHHERPSNSFLLCCSIFTFSFEVLIFYHFLLLEILDFLYVCLAYICSALGFILLITFSLKEVKLAIFVTATFVVILVPAGHRVLDSQLNFLMSLFH